MPIDYSQPGYKELFANYGLTAIAALSLEKSLLLLTAAIDNLGNGDLPKEMLQGYLEIPRNNPMRKRPMGNLVDGLNKRINISPSLEANLKEAVTNRNHIIHHFFIDEYEIMILPNGPTILSNKLRPIRDFFAAVHSEIDELLGLVIAELRKPKTEISPNIRNMLKGQDF